MIEGRPYSNTLVDGSEDQLAYSDHEHFHKGIKRQNLIDMFLQGAEIENYVTTHLYGDIRKVDDAGNTLNHSVQLDEILN